MPKVSLAFITTGALCGLAGMFWGMHMGASGDHSMMPAHAHLNLLGWVTLSIMGIFYALPTSYGGKAAWVNFGLSSSGAILMAPMLAYLLGNEAERGPTIGPLMMIPEGLVVLGMLVFLYDLFRTWQGKFKNG
ncbi:MAG: hypothetical protein U1E50_09920 [Caulobacteraceae bacterium]